MQTNISSLPGLPSEVLARVCNLLMQSSSGVRSVARLARTSRSLHEHAVNALWHTLYGYGLLVFTLPQDAWHEERKECRDITGWVYYEYHVVRLCFLHRYPESRQCGCVASVWSDSIFQTRITVFFTDSPLGPSEQMELLRLSIIESLCSKADILNFSPLHDHSFAKILPFSITMPLGSQGLFWEVRSPVLPGTFSATASSHHSSRPSRPTSPDPRYYPTWPF